MSNDTIFALSSGRPPAAVSVIRVSGSAAHSAGTAIAGSLPEARRAAVRTLRDASGQVLDDALVLRFDGPASSTGEDAFELHCHGGRAVVEAVLEALGAIEGLRPAEPGEFTRRAFENGRIDLTEAEGLADLIEAETQSQRKAALAVAEGGLRKQIEDWQARLVELAARAEAAIDYAEEDETAVDPSLMQAMEGLRAELSSWLDRPRSEPLKDGVRIVVAGPPNAGKSSLINAIAGQDKAIVTDVPGTTRDQIEVPLSLSGIPVLLTDTAGLRETTELVESIGIERARCSVAAADILLWLGDANDLPSHPRSVVVHSKFDLPGRESPPDGVVPVSAVTGAGIGNLMKTMANLSQAILPTEGAVALNRRQAGLVEEAQQALADAERSTDIVLIAESLRLARTAFDRLTGKAGVEDVLDALFGRFCLGK